MFSFINRVPKMASRPFLTNFKIKQFSTNFKNHPVSNNSSIYLTSCVIAGIVNAAYESYIAVKFFTDREQWAKTTYPKYGLEPPKYDRKKVVFEIMLGGIQGFGTGFVMAFLCPITIPVFVYLWLKS